MTALVCETSLMKVHVIPRDQDFLITFTGNRGKTNQLFILPDPMQWVRGVLVRAHVILKSTYYKHFSEISSSFEIDMI